MRYRIGPLFTALLLTGATLVSAADPEPAAEPAAEPVAWHVPNAEIRLPVKEASAAFFL
jgi:hypothetical protein